MVVVKSAGHRFHCPPPRAGGFSLLETLVAMVLLALLLAGVYAGVRSSIQLVRRGDAGVQRLDQLRSAQQFLRRELTQAMDLPIAQGSAQRPVYFSGSATDMRYAAALPGYLGREGPQLQRLQLIADDAGEWRLEARFQSLPPDGSRGQPVGEPQILVDHLRGGAFSYRGTGVDGQPAPWQPQWQQPGQRPRQVRIELMTAKGPAWPRLDVLLRLDASGQRGSDVGDLLRGLRGGGTP